MSLLPKILGVKKAEYAESAVTESGVSGIIKREHKEYFKHNRN